MQAAFVEIGLERTAFLHAADIAGAPSEDDGASAPLASPPAVEDIRRLVNCGDDILVQVIKDPIGTKGARLTTFIALPSRYLVYLPRGESIGVSAGVEEEIAKALDRKVPLKSGGHLVIDQTEAMTTIDVNTGAYVGHRNLEETIFRTNLEAAVSIARQLRLRNLGGIIIIDFIDMRDEPHRRAVLSALERALSGDRAQTHIVSLSPLGLVEMTRKRTRESLEHLMCQPCPSCEGRGFIRTPETVCNEIFREIVRQSRQFASRELLILAHQDVVDRLLDEESATLGELEAQVGRPIRLQVEALYGVDHYDVVLV